MEAAALRTWLEVAAHGAGHLEASREAVATMLEDPWRAVGFADLLARCELRTAGEGLGLTAALRVRSPGGASVVATVPAGRPYPALIRGGAPAPDRALALRVADAARSIPARPVRSAVDLQCGVGAVLLAMEAWGVPELVGVTTGPLEAALAATILPRARIVAAVEERFDVVVTREGGGNDRHATEAIALWIEEEVLAEAAWRERWLTDHGLRGLSRADAPGGGRHWLAGFAVGAGPSLVPTGAPWA